MKTVNKYEDELPECDGCETNKHVEFVCDDFMGSSFYCKKCKTSWAQET